MKKISAILMFFLAAMNFASAQEKQQQHVSASTSDEVAKDNESIRRNRMGTITIQTTPGAMVRVAQLRHEFWFGSSISTSAFNGRLSSKDAALYRENFLANFNCGVTENALKWKSTEPVRGKINYQFVDSTLAWADANKIPLRGHNIYWGVEQFVPDWVKQLDNAELKSVLEQRGRAVASRYRGRFIEYDLNNEMIHQNIFADRLGPKITLDMANWVKSEDPAAALFVNDYDITTGRKLKEYIAHIRELLNMGVPLAGIGVQGHLHGETFDRAELRKSLDQLAQFKLPIRITEFNLPGQRSKFYEHRGTVMTEDEATESGKELTDFLRICFADPNVTGFILWGFWEAANWIPESALYKRDWSITPNGMAYRDLVFKQWWTKWEGKADKQGRCVVPAFFGTHQVSSGNQTTTVELLKKTGNIKVTLK